MILENEMNKFPYIAESNQSKVPWLIYNESLAICLGNELHNYKKINNYDAVEFFSKNFTAEYLTNTYGKVESKEHAEFIVKLAEANGLRIASKWTKGKFFCFIVDCEDKVFLSFYSERMAKSEGEKLITIPLPPKESLMPDFNIDTPMPKVKEPKKVSMNEIQINVNNNTDSIVQVTKSDYESNIFIHVNDLPKSEEWPQVGDEVSFPSGKGVVFISEPDINGVIIVKSTDADSIDEYKKVSLNAVKKPPTHKEELRAKLISVMDNSNTAFTYADFISKAIINGEVEGLEYKPQ